MDNKMTQVPEDRYPGSEPGGMPGKSPPQPAGGFWPEARRAAPDLPPETDQEARNMAMLCHLLGAFLGILAPLVVWLVKKDTSPYVDDQGKEAVNFHITLLIAYLASSALYVVISIVTCGFGAFLVLPAVVGIVQVVLGILAGLKASEGEYYRYPYNVQWIK